MRNIGSRRVVLFLSSLVITFAAVRGYMWFSPNADLNVGGYNIHHLFTGLLLIAVGGIPLALGVGLGRWGGVATVIFGIGLGLALDEWVYLIATDGSNASYLLPVSFWGGVTMIGLAAGYALMLYLLNR